MDKSTRKRASSTLSQSRPKRYVNHGQIQEKGIKSQSRPKRYVNHGQIQEKGIKYTVTIKTQKVCKPWTNLLGKGHQVHCHNQDQKGM